MPTDNTPDQGDSTDESDDTRLLGTRVFTSTAARRAASLRIAIIGLALLCSTYLLTIIFPGLTDPSWLQAQLGTFGVLAPVAFIVLQALQVVIAPIPGQVLGGAAGYVFGAIHGTLYSLLGVLIGSGVVFLLSQWYGRPFVERAVTDQMLQKWDRFVNKHGTEGLFILFLLPTFPDDLLCFVAGLTEMRVSTFLVLVLVGRAPSFFAVAYAGTQLADGHLLTTGVVLTVLAVLSLVVIGTRERLLELFENTS